MDEVRAIDGVMRAILGVAAARGVFRGLSRELVSLAGLAAAVIGVRLFTTPGAAWLVEFTEGGVDPSAAPWMVGIAIALLLVGIARMVGRSLRDDLGETDVVWYDKLGGALLGGAKGGIVAAVLLLLLTVVIGRDAPLLEGTTSLALLEDLEATASGRDFRVPSVGAPPPR